MTDDIRGLLEPARLWSRSEVLTTTCVPRAAGVYAWYFRDVPVLVPTAGCVMRDQFTLLASRQRLHHTVGNDRADKRSFIASAITCKAMPRVQRSD
jgi:hypothetical protein